MPAHDRSKHLGGSDAAAVLGISSWLTPVELWQQKVGLAANDVDPDRERIFERGRRLEPFIRDMVIDKLRDQGHDVDLLACNQRYFHPKYKFISTEIDFELRVDGEELNSDAKSVTWAARKKWGEEGSEDIPIEYAAQFQVGLDVAPGQRKRCLVAALRSFDDVDIYWTVRDDETIEGIREKLVDFWESHVVTRVPPDPEKFSDISALFKQDNSRSIEASAEIVDKVDALREIAKLRKELDAEEESLKFDIAQFMGEHALLTRGVRNLITWETGDVGRFDMRAFKSKHPDWYALFKKSSRQRVMRIAGAR
jgi:predicted phage-related endonuclease